jgi:hypothetical protein
MPQSRGILLCTLLLLLLLLLFAPLIACPVLYHYQRHLATIPSGLPAEESQLMKKRRGQTIRTMEAMSVLDIARGLEDGGDAGERKGGKKKGGRGGDMMAGSSDAMFDDFSD